MEKIIFELDNVSIHYLDKEIFKIERLAVHQNDRIGIVGKNGVGKSTLLKLLAGEELPTEGKVNRFVQPAYFEQISEPKHFDIEEVYLSKLGSSPVKEVLSGGEQTKLKLAKIFSEYREALLLDEPTSHLDQRGIAFLLEQLTFYYGTLILVSHDRTLLDKLVTTIWEVADGRINIYKGNYSDYVEAKQLEHIQQIQAHELYRKEKKRLERAIQGKMEKAANILKSDKISKQKAKEKPSRLGKTKSKGTSQKAMYRAAKAMEKRIENLTEVGAIDREMEISFHHSKTVALHNKFPIMADQLDLYKGDNVLLKQASFQFPLGKRIAITGPNGSGKTTLLQYIANNGKGLILSPKAKIGVFDQLSYRFQTDETVLSFLKSRSAYEDGFLRAILSNMQFNGTDLQKKVTSLSGGEAVRLQLCQLFLGEYNILLLDEPTNFLDIKALVALEKIIQSYIGTVIFVSHDQAFIGNIAEIQYEIDPVQKILVQKG